MVSYYSVLFVLVGLTPLQYISCFALIKLQGRFALPIPNTTS